LCRALNLTGLQISVIDPVANAVWHTTGHPQSYSAILVIGVVAVGLLRALTAIGRIAGATNSQ
jgi:hypothetical protein